jgi:hypothetical protein
MLVLVIVAYGSATVPAAPVEFTFTGVVDAISDPIGTRPAPWNGVNVGDPWSITYRFESTAPDIDPSATNGVYEAIEHYSLTIGSGNETRSIVPTSGTSIRTYDNSAPGDAYQFYIPLADGTTQSFMQLLTNSNSALATPALPICGDINLPAFDSNPHFQLMGFGGGPGWNIHASVLTHSCGPCVPPPSGMIAWWPFDETGGTTVVDIAGRHNGTASPGPIGAIVSTNGPADATAWPPVMAAGGPKVDGALYFWHQYDNRFVRVPSASFPSGYPFGSDSFSIDAWVFITQSNGIHHIVEKMQYTGTTPNRGYHFYLESGLLTFEVVGTLAAAITQVGTVDQLTPGRWHHVAVTYCRPPASQNEFISLYINGGLKAFNNLPVTGDLGNNSDLIMGGSILGPAINYLDIGIDEVEIFDTCLAQPSIAAICGAGSAGKCKCAPLPDGSACDTTVCPKSNELCRPTEVVQDPTTGQIKVAKCDCVNGKSCYVEPNPGPSLIVADLSTGTTSGSPNPLGTVDPDWVVTVAPVAVSGDAFTVQPPPNWCPSIAATWIDPFNNGQLAADPAGNYDFQIQFTLNFIAQRDFELNINVAADNSAVVFLNGIPLGATAGFSCANKTNLITTNFLQHGVNILAVQVNNLNDGAPVGLLVEGGVSAKDKPICLGTHCPGTNRECELTETQQIDDGMCVAGVCVGGLNHGGPCTSNAQCPDKTTIVYDCCKCDAMNASVTIDLTTGVGYGGGLPYCLAPGGLDDTWTLVGTGLTPATVAPVPPSPPQVIDATPYPSWGTLPPCGTWLSDNVSASNGYYCYETCFCLNEAFQNAALDFSLFADDNAGVFLNNYGCLENNDPNATNPHWLISTPQNGFNPTLPGNPTVFGPANPSALVAGQNCIQVLLRQQFGSITGFTLEGQFTADNAECCCEPLDDGSACKTSVCPGTCVCVGGALNGQACPSCLHAECPGGSCQPTPGKECKPTQLSYDPLTQRTTVTKCDCVGADECTVVSGPNPVDFACEGAVCPFTGAQCPSVPLATPGPAGTSVYACCPKEPPVEQCPMVGMLTPDPCEHTVGTTECTEVGVICAPKCVEVIWMDNSPDDPFLFPKGSPCTCVDDGPCCGPVTVVELAPNEYGLECHGICQGSSCPQTDGICGVIHTTNGVSHSLGQVSVAVSGLALGDTVCCKCVPGPPDETDLATRSLRLKAGDPTTASGSGGQTAIKVTLTDLQNPSPPNAACCSPPNFGAFEAATCTATGEGMGCARWVGPPLGFLESNDNPSLGNYRAARLQCTPYYHDWATEPDGGLVSVIGAEIVPSSSYTVQVYGASCKGVEAACSEVSPAVIMTTRRAGDIATPYQSPTPPLTQPNALDVTDAVNKFRNLVGAPSKLVAQVQPNFPDPNSDINAIDVVTVVDNVRGFGYTYSGPCACPSSVPCNVTVCSGASACTGLYGAGATCIKTCSSGPRMGQPCNNNLNCGACIGGPLTGNGAAGIPCDANSDCASNNCGLGTCPTGATPGFCRDRCGRCN